MGLGKWQHIEALGKLLLSIAAGRPNSAAR